MAGLFFVSEIPVLGQEIRQSLLVDAPQTLPVRLEVAQVAGASPTVDVGIDQPIPPALPSGFDARILGPDDLTDLKTDVRGEVDESVFEIMLRPKPGALATRISWEDTAYPTGVIRLTGLGGSWDLTKGGEALIPVEGENDVLEVTIERGALPVELAAFAGVYSDGYVSLRWTTISETKNSGFEIQQRLDGASSFESVGFVEGAGTVTQSRHYAQRVPVDAPNTYVFRLVQVDTDGTRTPGPEVQVEAVIDRPLIVSPPAPNPARNHFQVRLAVAHAQPVQIALYDILGRRVYSIHDGPLTAQRAHTFTPETRQLASGVYFFVVEGEAFREVQKVHVVR
jgi:hypothetical protein